MMIYTLTRIWYLDDFSILVLPAIIVLTTSDAINEYDFVWSTIFFVLAQDWDMLTVTQSRAVY